VFDLKPGIIASATAFVLSFLIGIVSGAGILIVLLRALVFALVFFGLVFLAVFLLRNFMPELMPGAESNDSDQDMENDGISMDGDGAVPGTMVDLSIGGDDEDDLAPFLDAADQVNEKTVRAGMDQKGEDDYTGKGLVGSERRGTDGFMARAASVETVAEVPAKPPELIGDVDALPALDTFADSFVSPIGVEEGEGSNRSSASPSNSTGSGAGGDFKAKEMAMAIQTILKRDQKG